MALKEITDLAEFQQFAGTGASAADGADAGESASAKQEGGSGKPVLVYFTSQSCPPCKIVAPHVERLSKLYEGLIFVKVDVDAAKEIAAQARIRAMPTFQAYHNAALVGETVGANLNNIKGLVEKTSLLVPFVPSDEF